MTDSEATDYREAETEPSWPDAHAADPLEDPEKHVGAPMLDPWDDPGQTDWETHSVELDPKTMGV